MRLISLLLWLVVGCGSDTPPPAAAPEAATPASSPPVPAPASAFPLGLRPDALVSLSLPNHNRPGDGAIADPPEGADATARAAALAERGLNRLSAGLDDRAFALRAIAGDRETRQGVYLPAPGEAVWALALPEQAVFTVDAGLIASPLGDAASDGATLKVELEKDGVVAAAGEYPLDSEQFKSLRVDLSAIAAAKGWTGSTVRLRLRTDPGASPVGDYVMLGDPIVYTPQANPKRVVLTFIDTLRPDHMSLYGYDRPTTPGLDAWAQGAAVFTEARAVAPWTLPSARAVLTGRQPEFWSQGPTLQETLADRGYAAGACIANGYLSEAFGMTRGWTWHQYRRTSDAESQVACARAWLDAHPDRDVLLLVHFMDVHLPYGEPKTWRGRWEGEPVAGLKDPLVRPVLREFLKSKPSEEKLAKLRDYLVGRYDQSLGWLDSQLAPFLSGLGADTTVLLFADHGEEFFDHGDLEHGHSLYDELLRVPLVIHGPGLPAGRIAAPVSLLDLTPTVLELLGLPQEGLAGRPLGPAARGEATALAALEERPQAFGRLLYGYEAWGVLHRGQKWVSQRTEHSLFDLKADPREQSDRVAAEGADALSYLDHLNRALGWEVARVWRLEVSGEARKAGGLEILVSHPQGFKNVWRAYDPRRATLPQEAQPDGGLKMVWPAGERVPGEIYLQPTAPVEDPRGLSLTVRYGGETLQETVTDEPKPFYKKGKHPVILKLGDNETVRVFLTYAALPVPAGEEVPGFDEGMVDELKAMGYLE